MLKAVGARDVQSIPKSVQRIVIQVCVGQQEFVNIGYQIMTPLTKSCVAAKRFSCHETKKSKPKKSFLNATNINSSTSLQQACPMFILRCSTLVSSDDFMECGGPRFSKRIELPLSSLESCDRSGSD